MAIDVERKKYYRTEEGRRVGPMTGLYFKYIEGRTDGRDPEWDNDGRVIIRGHEKYGDIVAEWSDPIESPIRTVTRRFIEDGIYDGINISDHRDGSVKVRMHMGDEGRRYRKAELDRALLILSQLAEFLDEDKGEE